MMSHVQSTPLLSSTRCEQPWVPNIRREPWVVPTLRQELIAGMVNGFNDYLDSMLALAIHNMQSNIVEHFIASAACCSCYSYHVWSSRLVGLTFLRFLRVALFLHALQNHSGIESRDELGHRFLGQTPKKITFIRLCFKPICALQRTTQKNLSRMMTTMTTAPSVHNSISQMLAIVHILSPQKLGHQDKSQSSLNSV